MTRALRKGNLVRAIKKGRDQPSGSKGESADKKDSEGRRRARRSQRGSQEGNGSLWLSIAQPGASGGLHTLLEK